MSTIPQSLSDLKRYLIEKTGAEGKNFGIRGAVGARRQWGYHLGRSDIYGSGGYGDKDYSNRRRRDRAGLSEASSGFDIRLPAKELKRLTAYLVDEARAGRADLMEILGPDSLGAAKRWARPDWKPLPASADHRWHIHLSFPRDTETGDRVAMFEGLYGSRTPVEPEPEDPFPEPGPPPEPPEPEPTAEELLAQLAQDIESLAPSLVSTANRARQVGSDLDGIASELLSIASRARG